jgi:hypothetical protein
MNPRNKRATSAFQTFAISAKASSSADVGQFGRIEQRGKPFFSEEKLIVSLKRS